MALIARAGAAAPGGGTFTGFDSPALNNLGTSAFFGSTTGGNGLFLSDGEEGVAAALTGQALGGSTITSLSFLGGPDRGGRTGVNDLDQVAYQAGLANGSQALGLFTPDLHYRRTVGGSWDNASNWTLGLNPGQPYDVFIDPAASVTVFGPATNQTVDSLGLGGGTGLATLQLQAGAVLTAANGVTIASTGILTGDGTIAGNIMNQGKIVASNVTVQSTLTNQGVIEGSGRLHANIVNAAGGQIRVGAGQQMDLTGPGLANQGKIEVIGGELEVAAALSNAASTGLITGRNATLRFNGGLTNAGSVGLSFGVSDIFGDIANQAGGKVTLSGLSQTTFYDDLVNNGDVKVSAGSAAVFFGAVSGAGTFSGTGQHFFEGDLRPGNSPALVTVAGDMLLGALSTTEFELGGLLRGLEYDAFDVGGDLTLDGLLNVLLINGFSLGAGQSFEIFDVGGSLFGAFAGLGEGGLVGAFGGRDLFITYQFGDGNDVALFTTGTSAPVPEPSTWFLFGSGLAGLAYWRQRRMTSRA